MKKISPLVVIVLLTAACSPAETSPEPPPNIYSDETELEIRAECLTDKGWDAKLEDSRIEVMVPSSQRDLYLVDREACLEKSGAKLDEELSREDYEVAYQWYSEISSCLSQNHWPTPERPSFDNFQSTYDTNPWIPWELVSGEEYEMMFLDCPVADPTNHQIHDK